MNKTSIKDRFDEKWMPEPNTGCWLWVASIGSHGYGQIHANGYPVLAHRLSYEMHRETIPEGMTIDHLCRQKVCVNPDHMETVTLAENLRRADHKAGIPKGRYKATHCAKGHSYLITAKFNRSERRRYCSVCYRDNQDRKRLEKKLKQGVQS